MRKLMSLLATLALTMAVTVTALAGSTQGPSNPGETQTPPGETQTPPGDTDPGDGHSPGLLSNLMYFLGFD